MKLEGLPASAVGHDLSLMATVSRRVLSRQAKAQLREIQEDTEALVETILTRCVVLQVPLMWTGLEDTEDLAERVSVCVCVCVGGGEWGSHLIPLHRR